MLIRIIIINLFDLWNRRIQENGATKSNTDHVLFFLDKIYYRQTIPSEQIRAMRAFLSFFLTSAMLRRYYEDPGAWNGVPFAKGNPSLLLSNNGDVMLNTNTFWNFLISTQRIFDSIRKGDRRRMSANYPLDMVQRRGALLFRVRLIGKGRGHKQDVPEEIRERERMGYIRIDGHWIFLYVLIYMIGRHGFLREWRIMHNE